MIRWLLPTVLLFLLGCTSSIEKLNDDVGAYDLGLALPIDMDGVQVRLENHADQTSLTPKIRIVGSFGGGSSWGQGSYLAVHTQENCVGNKVFGTGFVRYNGRAGKIDESIPIRLSGYGDHFLYISTRRWDIDDNNRQTNQGRNLLKCSAPLAFRIRPAAPSGFSLQDGTIPTRPKITVQGLPSKGRVQLYGDASCAQPLSHAASVSGSSQTVTTETLKSGSYTIYARAAVDVRGKSIASDCSIKFLSYSYTVNAPSMSFASGTAYSATDRTPTVRLGNLYAGGKVQLFSNASCSSALSDQARYTGRSHDVTTQTLPRGESKIYAQSWDANGNASRCSANPLTYSVIVRFPTLILPRGPFSHTDNTPDVRLSGLHPGGKVQLFSDSKCTVPLSEKKTSKTATLSISTTPLAPGHHKIYAKAWDAQGDASPCTIRPLAFSYIVRSPTLTLTGATYTNTPTIRMSNLYVGGNMQLFSDASCTKPYSAQQSPTTTSKDVKLGRLSPGSYKFYAKGWDANGDSSTCSVPFIFTYAIKTPAITLIGSSPSHTDNTPAIRLSNLYSGIKANLFSDASCTISISVEQTTSGATMDISTNALSLGEHKIYAKAQDTGGHASACTPTPINFSFIVRPPTLALQGSPASYTDNTPSIRLSDLHTGGKAQLFSDSACSQALSAQTTTTSSTMNIDTNPLEPGTYKIYGKTWNAKGEASPCVGSVGFSYTIKNPTLALTGSSHTHTPTIRLSNLYSGGKAQLFSDSSCTEAISSQLVTSGVTKDIQANPVKSGSHDFYAKSWNANNHASECIGPLSFSYTVKAPILKLIGGTLSYTDNTPVIQVSNLYPGGKVQLFSDAVCTQAVSSQQATARATEDITTAPLEAGVHKIYAKSWDAGDNPSSCSGEVLFSYFTKPNLNLNLSVGKGIVQIISSANGDAFAVLKSDGSVVTWGNPYYGGDSSSVASEISSGVKKLIQLDNSIAALKENGKIVTWGWLNEFEKFSTDDLSQYPRNTQVFKKSNAGYLDGYIAINSDGSTLGLWSGNYHYWWSSGVKKVVSNGHASAALKNDGSVVTWGDKNFGGNSSVTCVHTTCSGPDKSVATELSSGVKKIFSTVSNNYYGSFAALKSDGSVVTWGDYSFGGNSEYVASKLTSEVTKIFATKSAFAALKSDGSVVTWGRADSGGDSSAVASKLTSGVIKIFSTDTAFAALKSDGSVVTWGSSGTGGDSSSVASLLASGVNKIFSTPAAFAALKSDGSVVTWGNSGFGGDSSAVASSLTSDVARIVQTERAFAALKNDGSVVTWGSAEHGGDSSSVASEIASGVTKVFPIEDHYLSYFIAVKNDGSMVRIGEIKYFSAPLDPLTNFLNKGSASPIREVVDWDGGIWAALKRDGSVVTSGIKYCGGDPSVATYTGTWESDSGDTRYKESSYTYKSVASQLTSGVEKIFSRDCSFAALKNNGSVVTWGHGRYGGDSSSVASQLTSGVTQIYNIPGGFFAMKEDGTGVTWGDISNTLSSKLTSGVSKIVGNYAFKADGTVVYLRSCRSECPPTNRLSGSSQIVGNVYLKSGSVFAWRGSKVRFSADNSRIQKIFSTGYGGAYAALKYDGSVVTWGDADSGGDSSIATYNPKTEQYEYRSIASSLTSKITDIFSNGAAFAALTSDESVITWGRSDYGGDSSAVSSKLTSRVDKVFSTGQAFAVLKKDGSVVTWGGGEHGGDFGSISSKLSSGITKVVAGHTNFVAFKDNGYPFIWGAKGYQHDEKFKFELMYSAPPTLAKQIQPVASEKDESISLLVTRGDLESTGQAVQFTWVTTQQTATAGSDYTESTGVGVIPIGKKSATITIPLINDTTKEDVETFKVTVVNTGDGSGSESIVSIYDDDIYFQKSSTPPNPSPSALSTQSPPSSIQLQSQSPPAPSFLQRATSFMSSWFGKSTPPPAPQSSQKQENPAPSGTNDKPPPSGTVETSGDKKAPESEQKEETKETRKPSSDDEKAPSTAIVAIGAGITKIVSTPTAFAALKADGRLLVWGEIEEDGEITPWKILADIVDISAESDTLTAIQRDGENVILNSRPQEEKEPQDKGPVSQDASIQSNTLGTLILNGAAPVQFEGADGATIPAEISRELFLHVREGESITLTLSLNKPLAEDLTLAYSVENITTTDEDWLMEEAREAVIPAGFTFANLTVTAFADDETEEEEALRVILAPLESDTVSIGVESAVVSIVANEGDYE